MITGTPYSNGKAFINFAQKFIDALSNNNYGEALSKLDMTEKKWKKTDLQKIIKIKFGNSTINSINEMKKSASPILTKIDSDTFDLSYKLPVNKKWSEHSIIFQFKRSKGEYFKVQLIGIN